MKKILTVAAIAATVLAASVALAAAPLCGDVNDDASIKTTDALLVLKKAVAQPISLDCSAYDNQFSACESSLAGANAGLSTCNSDLSTTNADLNNCQTNLSSTAADLTSCQGDLATCEAVPVCGDGLIAGDEECDFGNLGDETCATRGFAGGTLACSFCRFDEAQCYATRFDASGATVIDHQTGLEWEKKDLEGDSDFEHPHYVSMSYTWSSTGTAPNGEVFGEFLGRLNGNASSSPDGPVTGCYAGHCDWRLPTVEELQTIVDLSASGCGMGDPCIDPAFGPASAFFYWSSTTYASDNPPPVYGEDNSSFAWVVYFGGEDGYPADFKTAWNYVRAVRSRS